MTNTAKRASDSPYDLIVLGGGMAGLPIANKAAYKGLRTALVERETLGGTCLTSAPWWTGHDGRGCPRPATWQRCWREMRPSGRGAWSATRRSGNGSGRRSTSRSTCLLSESATTSGWRLSATRPAPA